jgi:hypothetical protein
VTTLEDVFLRVGNLDEEKIESLRKPSFKELGEETEGNTEEVKRNVEEGKTKQEILGLLFYLNSFRGRYEYASKRR